jgi:hypothetical protein
MTTTQPIQSPSRDAGVPLAPTAAVVTIATLALDAFGIWGYGSTDSDAGTEMLVTGALTVVSVAVVFGLVLPRALRSDNPGRTGLVLSVLALLVSVPLFWAGVAPALAVGGILAGRAGSSAPQGRRMAGAAFVIGILAIIGCVGTYAGDLLSQM